MFAGVAGDFFVLGGCMNTSQTEAIRKYLKRGQPLTALEAVRLFGCMRLAARIADLRAAGHNINSKRVRLFSGKHVAEYRMAR